MEGYITHQGEQVGIGLQSFGQHFATILTLASRLRTLGIISLDITVPSPSVTLATFTHRDGKQGTIRWEDCSSLSSSQPGDECAAPVSEKAKPGGS